MSKELFKLTSLNLNGIRSASSKGFAAWIEKSQPHCICVQEVKAQYEDVKDKFEEIAGMKGYFHFAEKKGYSGVGIYTKETPTEVIAGIGNTPAFDEFNAEGRYVELRFDTPSRKFSIISCYYPSGSSGEERQQAKFRFLALIYPHLMQLKTEREFILCGDINIAHQEADLKNYKGNKKNSGFLPEERAWMSQLLHEGDDGKGGGLKDVYRLLQPDTTETCYTWWSNRGQAYANNVGWRLDYHLATPKVAALAKHEEIYKAERFSDHAPMTISYDFSGF